MEDLILELLTKLVEHLALALGGVFAGVAVPVIEGFAQRMVERWKQNRVMVNAGAAQQRATTDQALTDTAKEAKELGDAVDTAGDAAADRELAFWRKSG